jgi:hypothetical protein
VSLLCRSVPFRVKILRVKMHFFKSFFKATTTMSSTQVFYLSQQDAIRKLSSTHPCMLVLLRSAADTRGQVMVQDRTAFQYSVFGYFQNQAQPWGYAVASKVVKGWINKDDCLPSPTRMSLRVHDSFAHYATRTTGAAEVDIGRILWFVEQRLVYYAHGWESDQLDPSTMCMATPKDVVLDNIAYFFVMASLCGDAPSLFKWIQKECALSACRFTLPNGKPRLSYVEKRGESLVLPFEMLPPYILAKRLCILKRGEAFLPLDRLPTLRTYHVYRTHRNNSNLEIQVTASQLRGLARQTASRFREIVGIQPPSLARPLMPFRLETLPPCVKSLWAKAVDLQVPAHLVDAERWQLARFLVDMGWSKERIIEAWTPKFTKAKGSMPANVKSCIASTERFALMRAKSGVSTGASCFGMFECGACPYKQARLDERKGACMHEIGGRWPQAKPFPTESLKSPQHYVQLMQVI